MLHLCVAGSVTGSYVAEPRLLAWFRERTVLVKSEHELHAIYRECYKLIFAFATQSSLSIVRNDNVRNAVPTRGTCRAHTAASVPHTQTCSRTRYFGTVPCRKTCTNHDYAQLHIDDAILCIIDDVMIVLYWDTDSHLIHKNCKG